MNVLFCIRICSTKKHYRSEDWGKDDNTEERTFKVRIGILSAHNQLKTNRKTQTI